MFNVRHKETSNLLKNLFPKRCVIVCVWREELSGTEKPVSVKHLWAEGLVQVFCLSEGNAKDCHHDGDQGAGTDAAHIVEQFVDAHLADALEVLEYFNGDETSKNKSIYVTKMA